ncbi:MAG TPA: hypothetical protein VFW28_14720 [Micropepsaceae bacterium]|nr:hypothetical protein [Micropepsaceae bacterium]
MRSRTLLLGSFIALLAVPAMAQGNNAIDLRGTVDKFDGTTIQVKDDKGGEAQTFKIAPKVLYIRQEKARLSDIKTNDFVASAAVRKADGKLHSTELRIFSEGMRGLGDGQRPMNDERSQTMTNATVTGTAIVNGSNVMRVKFGPSKIGGKGETYPGGESDLVLDPNVPVFKFTDAESNIVKAGEHVRVQGVRNAQGEIVNRVTVMP